MTLKDKIEEHKRLITYVCIGMMIAVISFAFAVGFGGDLRNDIDMYHLGKNFQDKNLSQIPYEYNLNQENIYYKDLEEFKVYLQKDYFYEEDTYDCKYWTFIWSYWAWHHKDKYDFKIIATDNHIFGMIYNSLGYCILDLDNVICFGGIDGSDELPEMYINLTEEDKTFMAVANKIINQNN